MQSSVKHILKPLNGVRKNREYLTRKKIKRIVNGRWDGTSKENGSSHSTYG